jgi:carboxyl-terminal processing protease
MKKNFDSKKHGFRRLSKVLLAVLFLFGSISLFAAQSRSSTRIEELKAKTKIDSGSVVEKICSQIYEGDFADARKLLEAGGLADATLANELEDIISSYEQIAQARQDAKEDHYAEQLEELSRLENPIEPNDVNDANDLSKVLSVIAKAGEYADEDQKAELLNRDFVKATFQRAIDKSTELEANGKWLDGYISCYSWLSAIDKDNKTYEDYADDLLEKANIVASFQDSPCETSSERYENIEQRMFTRTIDALSFGYVSVIDYAEMGRKALTRCERLGEVMEKIAESNSVEIIEQVYEDDKKTPVRSEGLSRMTSLASIKTEKLSDWLSGLYSMKNEVNQSLASISKDKFLSIFNEVLELNAATMELPETVLIAQFSDAALRALDPYTTIIWPKHVKDFDKAMTNEFTGIGVEISKEKGLLSVGSLLPDTPAYNSGLDAGDIIEKVDGVDTKDMSIMCAVKSITGPAGTDVVLTVRTPNKKKQRQITITRAKIVVPTIRGQNRNEKGRWLNMIDEQSKIGYVRLTSFSEKSAADFEKLLIDLEAQGMQGLILDLRFNSGGLLSSAIEIADKFLTEGLIVSTRPKWHQPRTYAYAHKKATHPPNPLVILINGASASASEIVAGALADTQHERALLVGSRTTGKGSVQTITGHPGGGAQLKYTMAYYHLPSGQKVESPEAMKKRDRDDWGVAPDVKIKLRSDELRKMLEMRRDNDVLVKKGHNDDSEPLEKHSVQDMLDADPQLAVGVLVIKAMQLERRAKSLN